MSKEMGVIALGIWVMIIPYLGVPGSWRSNVLLATGVVIILVGFALRAEVLSRGVRRTHQHPFVENERHHDTATSHERKEGISSLN